MRRSKLGDLAASEAAFSNLGDSRVRDEHGRVVVEVSAAALAQQPWLKWNAFVALLSSAVLEELHPAQTSAWRVLEYESEIQNGGHELYFDVREGRGLDEAVAALAELGAGAHAKVLGSAVEEWRSGAVADFRKLDDAFAACVPSLVNRLEAWLESHPGDFVVVA